jgi:uridine kinase
MILEKRRLASAAESVLIAVSGIDGSGKGYVSAELVAQLQRQGLRAVVIGADGWLNLPECRFDRDRTAEHFYHHAIRFDEMFTTLVLPLKRQRSIRALADYVEETASAYRKHIYEFWDVDVIVLEGIFLLKRALRPYYDGAIWVDCTFETALERALRRGQEGLAPDKTIHAYQTTYFPAHIIHERLDDPRSAADVILRNDPRLEERPPSALEKT